MTACTLSYNPAAPNLLATGSVDKMVWDTLSEVDFVVLGLGWFSSIPNIPEFPPGKGPETFHGEVRHSRDYAAMDYELAAKCIKGKRIVIVVLQKSAKWL
ncbi:hypothetical protein SCA6_011899 [Theobroma cacao]